MEIPRASTRSTRSTRNLLASYRGEVRCRGEMHVVRAQSEVRENEHYLLTVLPDRRLSISNQLRASDHYADRLVEMGRSRPSDPCLAVLGHFKTDFCKMPNL